MRQYTFQKWQLRRDYKGCWCLGLCPSPAVCAPLLRGLGAQSLQLGITGLLQEAAQGLGSVYEDIRVQATQPGM